MTLPGAPRDLSCLQINLASSSLSLQSLHIALDISFTTLCAISDPPLHCPPSLFPNHCIISSVPDSPKALLLLHRSVKYRLSGPPSNRVTSAIISSTIGPVAVISFYLQPQTAEGLPDLIQHIQAARKHTPRILLLGDSNGHSPLWGPAPTNPQGQKLENLILSEDLIVLNDPNSAPTFTSRDNRTSSWIDITLASPPLATRITHWSIQQDLIPPSDHSAILSKIALRPSTHAQIKRDWLNTDWTAFSQEFVSSLPDKPRLSDLPTTAHIDAHITAIQHAYQSAISRHVPLKTICSHSKPWFTPEVRSAYLKMKEATKQSRQANTTSAFAHYKLAKAEFQNAARMAKTEAFRRFASSLNGSNMWSSFKRLSRHKPPFSSIPPLAQESQWIDNPQDKLRLLASSLFPKPTHPPSSRLQSAQELVSNWKPRQSCPPPTITPSEIRLALLRGRPLAAPGPDGITYKCLHETADLVTPFLRPILNRCLQLGYFPTAWKLGQTLPLPKPNKPPHLPSSYRPITLLDTLSKTFERILLNRLRQHLSDTHFHHSSQHGFITQRSTSTALWHLHHSAFTAFKTRTQLAAISFDLSNAFDRAQHPIILQELIQAQTPAYLISSVQSFLSNRATSLQDNSDLLRVQLHTGTPQGSVLSPLLFTLIANTLPPLLPTEVQPLIYADDILILVPAPKSADQPLLQHTANIVTNWSISVHIPLNPTKCRLLRLSRLLQAPPISVILQDQTIDEAATVKYLGITLDTRLTYSQHIQDKTQSASSRLSVLHRLAHSHFGSSPSIISRLFQACIAPILLYAAPCFAHVLSTNATARRQVSRLYAHGARLTLGLHRTTPLDTAIALASFRPPHLSADAALLRLKPRLTSLHIPDSHSNLPSTHYSPADHLQLLTRLIQFPRSTTRSLRLQQRNQEPPPLPSVPSTLRHTISAYTEYTALKDWQSSDHSSTLHQINFNPLQWRHWYKHLDRRSTTALSRFLTDHFPCRSYLHRFGLSSDDTCRFCSSSPETPQHLLLQCPNLRTSTDIFHSFLSGQNAHIPTHLLTHLAIEIIRIEDSLRNTPLSS